MPARNLIVCCDGTSNEFGYTNTNVVRLLQSLDKASTNQQVFYDPGVGTMPGSGWRTEVGKKASQLVDLAIAVGLEAKVENAYRYLMNTWRPGDHVFIFGFSRGAYTARVLAGMLHAMGLLPPHDENLVPYAMQIFSAVRGDRRRGKTRESYTDVADQFRTTFAQPVPERTDRRFGVHFLGLWDTVSSVGLPWEEKAFAFTADNPAIAHVRHAVSLDERRAFFRQNLVHPSAGQDVKERWFAGVHCDIGGGYVASDSGVCAASLGWMMNEATACGLQTDATSPAMKVQTPDGKAVWGQRTHTSLKGLWYLLEVVPKPTFNYRTHRRELRMNLGRPRFVGEASLHQSLAERIYNDRGYNPPNLSRTFLDAVRAGPAPAGDVPYRA
jgi:uncharacterized protein (DUF2235 family)